MFFVDCVITERSGWDQARADCNTNIDAVPCPGNRLSCPDGELCFALGLLCTPVTARPTSFPTDEPTTGQPATSGPTASPIGADDVANAYFCGRDEADANALCGTGRGRRCRGTDEECPDGEFCFATDAGCRAADLGYTAAPTTTPTPAASTGPPTEDPNPDHRYCADSPRDWRYDGECGVPCPRGAQRDCPPGMTCYSGLTGCTKTHRVGMAASWCGATFEGMAKTCRQECPNGTDDECPSGERCWGDSPCALLDEKREAEEEKKAMLWCARSYKQLVEHCPGRCPGGTNGECGQDEDGHDMLCFDMSEEEEACRTAGVGVREPVDPDRLWCGRSWNQ